MDNYDSRTEKTSTYSEFCVYSFSIRRGKNINGEKDRKIFYSFFCVFKTVVFVYAFSYNFSFLFSGLWIVRRVADTNMKLIQLSYTEKKIQKSEHIVYHKAHPKYKGLKFLVSYDERTFSSDSHHHH